MMPTHFALPTPLVLLLLKSTVNWSAEAIIAYEKRYGFMGLFLVRPDYRGHGLSNRPCHERKRRLLGRLDANGPIGMEGVFNMQHYYTSNGFGFVCRDLRFQGRGMNAPQRECVVDVRSLPFDRIDAYDRRHFLASRTSFLRTWIDRPGGHSLALMQGEEISGYAVMRPLHWSLDMA